MPVAPAVFEPPEGTIELVLVDPPPAAAVLPADVLRTALDPPLEVKPPVPDGLAGLPLVPGEFDPQPATQKMAEATNEPSILPRTTASRSVVWHPTANCYNLIPS